MGLIQQTLRLLQIGARLLQIGTRPLQIGVRLPQIETHIPQLARAQVSLGTDEIVKHVGRGGECVGQVGMLIR